MLRQTIAIILLIFCFPVFANTKGEFKHLLHELQYDLTVEWNQKDDEFLKQKVASFEESLTKLQRSGLTANEIREVLKELLQSPSALGNFELLTKLNNFSSSSDIIDFLKRNHSQMQNRGASWNGEVLIYGGFAVALIGMILIFKYVILDDSEYICTEYAAEQTCSMDQWCMTYNEQTQTCDSWSSPTEYCSYPCVNGYYKD